MQPRCIVVSKRSQTEFLVFCKDFGGYGRWTPNGARGPVWRRAFRPVNDGQPEDEGDDPDDDELAQEELADEARAERAAEGLGEAEAMEEDA